MHPATGTAATNASVPAPGSMAEQTQHAFMLHPAQQQQLFRQQQELQRQLQSPQQQSQMQGTMQSQMHQQALLQQIPQNIITSTFAQQRANLFSQYQLQAKKVANNPQALADLQISFNNQSRALFMHFQQLMKSQTPIISQMQTTQGQQQQRFGSANTSTVASAATPGSASAMLPVASSPSSSSMLATSLLQPSAQQQQQQRIQMKQSMMLQSMQQQQQQSLQALANLHLHQQQQQHALAMQLQQQQQQILLKQTQQMQSMQTSSGALHSTRTDVLPQILKYLSSFYERMWPGEQHKQAVEAIAADIDLVASTSASTAQEYMMIVADRLDRIQQAITEGDAKNNASAVKLCIKEIVSAPVTLSGPAASALAPAAVGHTTGTGVHALHHGMPLHVPGNAGNLGPTSGGGGTLMGASGVSDGALFEAVARSATAHGTKLTPLLSPQTGPHGSPTLGAYHGTASMQGTKSAMAQFMSNVGATTAQSKMGTQTQGISASAISSAHAAAQNAGSTDTDLEELFKAEPPAMHAAHAQQTPESPPTGDTGIKTEGAVDVPKSGSKHTHLNLSEAEKQVVSANIERIRPLYAEIDGIIKDMTSRGIEDEIHHAWRLAQIKSMLEEQYELIERGVYILNAEMSSMLHTSLLRFKDHAAQMHRTAGEHGSGVGGSMSSPAVLGAYGNSGGGTQGMGMSGNSMDAKDAQNIQTSALASASGSLPNSGAHTSPSTTGHIQSTLALAGASGMHPSTAPMGALWSNGASIGLGMGTPAITESLASTLLQQQQQHLVPLLGQKTTQLLLYLSQQITGLHQLITQQEIALQSQATSQQPTQETQKMQQNLQALKMEYARLLTEHLTLQQMSVRQIEMLRNAGMVSVRPGVDVSLLAQQRQGRVMGSGDVSNVLDPTGLQQLLMQQQALYNRAAGHQQLQMQQQLQLQQQQIQMQQQHMQMQMQQQHGANSAGAPTHPGTTTNTYQQQQVQGAGSTPSAAAQSPTVPGTSPTANGDTTGGTSAQGQQQQQLAQATQKQSPPAPMPPNPRPLEMLTPQQQSHLQQLQLQQQQQQQQQLQHLQQQVQQGVGGTPTSQGGVPSPPMLIPQQPQGYMQIQNKLQLDLMMQRNASGFGGHVQAYDATQGHASGTASTGLSQHVGQKAEDGSTVSPQDAAASAFGAVQDEEVVNWDFLDFEYCESGGGSMPSGQMHHDAADGGNTDWDALSAYKAVEEGTGFADANGFKSSALDGVYTTSTVKQGTKRSIGDEDDEQGGMESPDRNVKAKAHQDTTFDDLFS